MTETVIKGSGNSRSIKSVPNLAQLAPTYDKLLDLLTGEGLPVDLGPLNPAGLAQRGTDLNKANLLSDEVERALFGSTADRTPNQAFDRLRALVQTAQSTANGSARIVLGIYTGTGTFGEANRKTLTFPFEPKAVGVQNYQYSVWIIRGNVSQVTVDTALRFRFENVQWTGNSVSWYGTNPTLQANANDEKYYYIAIG